eukprot:m.458991 g.458991  ORF g.458991 m.458991 type:complete len:57 (-) comp21639_c0_seq1:2-172(-)
MQCTEPSGRWKTNGSSIDAPGVTTVSRHVAAAATLRVLLAPAVGPRMLARVFVGSE